MAQTGAGLQAGAQGEAVAFPLIGVEGTDYVSNLLTANPPQVATRNIQKAAGLQQPLCAPLLGLLDQLGISRYDAHMGMLKAAKKALLYQVNMATDTIKLERLLQASFNYLGIQELKDVPLAVMEKLEQVPTVHLKQLALDKAIFRELPAKVQRQVWEYDKNLLQADALPPVGRYKYETATIMRGLAMDEFLPAAAAALAAARPGKTDGKGIRAGKGAGDDSDDESAGGLSLARTGSGLGRGGGRRSGGGPSSGGRGGVPAPRPVTRKILRKGSYVVQLLRSMVGSSPKIYSQIVELCMVKYRDSDVLYVGSKEASYCTLRANLLMALHDVNSPVAEKDRCHELAWTLDAGITNGFLTEKHIAKLTKFFDDMQQTESAIASRLAEAKRKNKDKPVQDEAESAGNVLGGGAVEPYLALGDASVILRDPSAQHLLAGAVFQMVLPAALEGKLPSELPGLPGLLRMMTLGVEGRTMLRERKYRFPTIDQRLIHDLLPLLCSWALIHEAEPSKSNAELQGPTIKWGLPKDAVSVALDLLPISEVARRLTQTFAVGRLLEQDWLGATRACKLLATALHKSLPAIQQGWDFAGTMAMRLADLIKAGVLFPQSSLFYWAVQQLIIYAVDAHTQVHEEILRLLLAAAPQLQPEELGEFLELTMKHSKKSRRRLVKKGLQEPSFSGFPGMAFSAEMGSDIGSDIGSDGWAGIHNLKLRAGDGVRSVYKEFLKLPNVTAAHAPELHKYLSTDGDEEPAKG